MARRKADARRIRHAEVGQEFSTCPECGYDNGFHNMFRPTSEEGVLDWCMICPGCSRRFDLGLKVLKPAGTARRRA